MSVRGFDAQMTASIIQLKPSHVFRLQADSSHPDPVAGGFPFFVAIRQSSSFWLGFGNLFSGGADAVVEGHTDASKPPIRRFGR